MIGRVLYVRDKHIEKGFMVEGPLELCEELIREYLIEHDIIGPSGLHLPKGVYPYIPFGNYQIELHWDILTSKPKLMHNCINDRQAHIILLKFLNVKMEDDKDVA